MIIFYHKKYNIDFGFLNKLHPFDGLKFKKVIHEIITLPGIKIQEPEPIGQEAIDEFVDTPLRLQIRKKSFIMRALEIPNLPFLPFFLIKRFILLPMRYGVGGTLAAAKEALKGQNCWNLSGGYHHASQAASEGFCIYNDVGIAVQQLRKQNMLSVEDRVLIIDIDAHHGNGNAQAFMKDSTVFLFDIFNGQIYPQGHVTKERLNISIPLNYGTSGQEYLVKLNNGLQKLESGFKLAFVVAGTDVVATDPLGGLGLSVNECYQRDALVLHRLSQLSIPAVFLGGGGYSEESAVAIATSIEKMYSTY